MPPLKVYDLRRNRVATRFILQANGFTVRLVSFICRSFSQKLFPKERFFVSSSGVLKLLPHKFSFGALRFPFFKLVHSFLAVKVIHDRRDKRPRKRVDLVLRDLRVALSSRHSPLLCSLLDSLPPFKRLFSCYLPPRSRPLDLNGDTPDFFARDFFNSASNSFGQASSISLTILKAASFPLPSLSAFCSCSNKSLRSRSEI